MKNYRKFKIVSLRDCADCGQPLGFDPITITATATTVLNAIASIFGGGSGTTGMPGDYDNRVRTVHQWATQKYNVAECVDWNYVAQVISIPSDPNGPWQGQIEYYMNNLLHQRNTTGSCMSSTSGIPGSTQSGIMQSLSGGSGLLIIGAIVGLGLLLSKKGKGK